jgi:hypothetical protein
MKAAIVTAAGVDPTYEHFRDPVLQEGLTIVTVVINHQKTYFLRSRRYRTV